MKEINYDHYSDYAEMESYLYSYAEEYPDMVRLSVLAVTEGNRNIYLLEVTDNVNDAASEEKPGYYIQASQHSSEPAGLYCVLHLMQTLLIEKPDILKKVIFYIIPRVNPDGVEVNLLYNATTRSKNAVDPRRVENVIACKDMDGDGLVLNMRIRNPLGDYKEIAPGIMAPREPGETEGDFYDLYVEGEVQNPNGLPLDYNHRMYDFNRCYPYNWKPGINNAEYPARHTESRAVMEFLVTHPNIFAGVDYHNGPNAILRSPMCDDSLIPKQDLKLINRVGEMAAEITGFPLIQEYHYGGYCFVRSGNSNDFAYNILGITHYVIELGNSINDIGMNTVDYLNEGRDDSWYGPRIQAFNEKEGNQKVFYDFKPFHHPQLGDVEIGGARMGSAYQQNPRVHREISPKTTEFMLKHAEMRPILVTGNTECLPLGNNLYRIRSQIKNMGLVGTKIMKVDSYNAAFPVHISLEASGLEILSRPNTYEIDSLDPLESTYVEWFVKVPSDSTLILTAVHPKADNAREEIRLTE